MSEKAGGKRKQHQRGRHRQSSEKTLIKCSIWIWKPQTKTWPKGSPFIWFNLSTVLWKGCIPSLLVRKRFNEHSRSAFLTPQFFAPYYILFSYLQYQALLFCPVMDLLHPLLSFSTPTLWFWVPSCYPTCHELPWVTSPSKGHWHIRELSGHLPQHVLPLSMHKKSAFLLNAFHSNYLKGSQSPSLTGSPVPLKKGKQGKEGAKYHHVTRLVGVGVEEDWQEGVIGHIRAEQKVEL